MSDLKHTAEPWRLSSKSKRVVNYGYDSFTVNSEANARRIVACVNALAHVSTEELESGKLQSMVQRAADAEKQRDQLLAALECLFASYKQLADSGDAGNWSLEDYDEGKKALAAIAAVKCGA